MFKINDIKELIRAVDRSSIAEISIKGENNVQLTISKHQNASQVTLTEETQVLIERPVAAVQSETKPIQKQEKVETQEMNANDSSIQTISSPMVGTFYAAPSPESEPYVRVGDQIKEGSVLCIVEAMKLMNELEAEVNGEIVEILVKNGQLVEYGMPLFHVKTA
jgi:acetyl-CoA carboxylase biotin carboxyl carrier protein